ncbi:unnamed protein product [Cylicocyclus nassatus]|uniref:LITAF domain-containing protein n=1 Tax=Cylicocyclus nassatus TaxID=53992 RepID=A0AA36GUB7_CYLNA|nr:unnamed protein product [Cylicocyclus nassatus]
MCEPPPAYETLNKSSYPRTPTAPILTPCQPSPSVYCVPYSTMEQPGNSSFPGPPPNPAFVTITFGGDAVCMVCPHCNQQIITRISPRPGAFAYFLCVIMILFGCWLCCFIPFCIEGCQDTEHRCPNCDRVLGIYRRI